MTDAERILQAASEEAVRQRGGAPAEALEHVRQVSRVLAAWCAGLARTTSHGQVRAGLGPVGQPVEQPGPLTLLRDGE